MKHHTERIRHLQQLRDDLDRVIADAQELQKNHRLAPARETSNPGDEKRALPRSSGSVARKRR